MNSKRPSLVGFCVLILATIACNIPNAQATLPVEVALTVTQAQTTPTLLAQFSGTPFSTATPEITLTPTITFTPMPIRQLAAGGQFDFTQPLPLSTPIADPDSVSGVIYNGYGHITNAVVAISETYCGPRIKETRTDSLGRYTLTGISAGIYYLDVNSPSVIGLCGEEIRKIAGVGLARDFIRPRDGLVMIFPKDQQAVDDTRPTVEWQAVGNAAYYVVELTVQTSGGPGWSGDWTGKYLGTWLTNSTTFTIPLELNSIKDYKLNIIAFTAGRLPLKTAFEIRFHY
jgi:hypothetical protein